MFRLTRSSSLSVLSQPDFPAGVQNNQVDQYLPRHQKVSEAMHRIHSRSPQDSNADTQLLLDESGLHGGIVYQLQSLSALHFANSNLKKTSCGKNCVYSFVCTLKAFFESMFIDYGKRSNK